MNQAPIIIVFGITGDLSRRKLLPALYHLLRQAMLPPETALIGLSRRELDKDELLGTVELCVLEKDKVCDPAGIKKVRESLDTLQLDPAMQADYAPLAALLQKLDPHHKRARLFYMSVPTSAYANIVHNLAAAGLNDEHCRLLVEKPFGHDYATAEQLITLTREAYSEEQVYRIDHYLAKETAQNLLAFRMHNPIFAPIWNNQHITTVHVRALEKIGIEGRAGFYEQTGALRDLVQSHLMQLLAITLMDLPADMTSQAIHESKQHFLSQLMPADPEHAERGQYQGYKTEVDNPLSSVETYAKLHLGHQAERWQGTTIILETGKAMAEKTTDITIEFKQPHDARRNSLHFQLQPNEGITLDLMVKEPGFETHMRRASLDFRYQDVFGEQQIDAYERVLMDAVRGDQSLFASDAEVLATWRVLEPLLEVWRHNDEGLLPYEIGSATPLKS